jgi:hypothetical protein
MSVATEPMSTFFEKRKSMAYELNASNLLNPIVVWSDLGLRALDMTVSSTQNISERVDRLTRAGAGVELAEVTAPSSAVPVAPAFATPSGTALSADLQRSPLDLMMQGWMQGWLHWMSTLGTFASLATGPGLPFAAAEAAPRQARPASSSRQQSARHAAGGSRSMEHALASAEPKRRGRAARTKTKVRRSRSG